MIRNTALFTSLLTALVVTAVNWLLIPLFNHKDLMVIACLIFLAVFVVIMAVLPNNYSYYKNQRYLLNQCVTTLMACSIRKDIDKGKTPFDVYSWNTSDFSWLPAWVTVLYSPKQLAKIYKGVYEGFITKEDRWKQ